MSTPKLTGNRCQCTGCGEVFTCERTFDAHRRGPYSERLCLTADEMLAGGWAQNARGFWTNRPVAPGHAYFDAAGPRVPGPVQRDGGAP